ncbi:hypothetical protein DFH06DRAFT_1150617, partial [Mycena polygramma]
GDDQTRSRSSAATCGLSSLFSISHPARGFLAFLVGGPSKGNWGRGRAGSCCGARLEDAGATAGATRVRALLTIARRGSVIDSNSFLFCDGAGIAAAAAFAVSPSRLKEGTKGGADVGGSPFAGTFAAVGVD